MSFSVSISVSVSVSLLLLSLFPSPFPFAFPFPCPSPFPFPFSFAFPVLFPFPVAFFVFFQVFGDTNRTGQQEQATPEQLSAHIGNSTEHLRKSNKSDPNMTPKWFQNGAKSGPKTIQGALRTDKRKLIMNSLIFGRRGGPKWRPKIIKKSIKITLELLLSALKKTMIFQELCFPFFSTFYRSPTLNIKPKRYTVYKKRGSALFEKKLYFPKKLPKRRHPGDPKRDKNAKNSSRRPSGNPLRKNLKN